MERACRLASRAMESGYAKEEFASSEKSADDVEALPDWIGPLESVYTEAKGRGVRSTSGVQAGDVLLVQRALLCARHDPRATNNIVADIRNSVRRFLRA